MSNDRTPLADLTARLERLERQNRGLKAGAVAAILVAGLALLLRGGGAQGVDKPPYLKASALDIVDDSGKVRVGMGVDKDGHSSLTLSDAGGVTRLDLLVTKDGFSQVRLWDPVVLGKYRAAIGVDKPAMPFVNLFSKDGKIRGSLFLNADDAPDLKLYDSNGKMRVWMNVNSKDPQDAGLGLYDADGKNTWFSK
jgi:hypothetical protein